MGDEIELVLQQRLQPRRRIGDGAIDHPVELGQAGLPVVRVPCQHDLGAALAFDLERPIADRHSAVGLVAHLLVRLGAQDRAAIAQGDAGEGAERLPWS